MKKGEQWAAGRVEWKVPTMVVQRVVNSGEKWVASLAGMKVYQMVV